MWNRVNCFYMHLSSFLPLYAFSWQRSLSDLPFICIYALSCPMYAFSWPCSLLNLPFICIENLFYSATTE